MELHERLTTARQAPPPGRDDPFAEIKNRVHMAVIGDLGPQLFNVSMDPVALRDRVLVDIRRHLSDEQGISRDDRERLASAIADDALGHGPLERLLADDTHMRRIINKIVAEVGRRVDESSPMVDARLPDGSRVNIIIPPLSLSGPLITIRKFSKKRLNLDELIKLGSLNSESVDYLQRCVHAELNILISGGTGSGKTTLLNALS